MRSAKRLAVTGLAVALLAVAAPAPAGAAAYRHYVACGHSAVAKPSHACERKRKKGAFFLSNRPEIVHYTVCVRFPNGKSLCARNEKAVPGKLYVNKIFSTIPGRHKVTWFVEGQRIGLFEFRVLG